MQSVLSIDLMVGHVLAFLRNAPMWVVVIFALLLAGKMIQHIWSESRVSKGGKTALTIGVLIVALFLIGYVQGKREAEEQKRKQWQNRPSFIETLPSPSNSNW